MRWSALSLPAVGGLIFLATPAEAASFDCGRARAADEVTVCHTPSLSALDSEMGGLWYAYSRVPMAMGMNANRGEEARGFLASRHACARNIACLTALYRRRNAALRQAIDSAMADYERMQNE